MSANYQRFSEHNEHEGEDWFFYIGVEGNEVGLEELARLDLGTEYEYEYDLDFSKIFTAQEVQLFLDHDNHTGYLPRHTRLEGRLDVGPLKSLSPQERHDFLYKGGIRGLMRVE